VISFVPPGAGTVSLCLTLIVTSKKSAWLICKRSINHALARGTRGGFAQSTSLIRQGSRAS
jgi:hypothetical protein